MKWKRGLAKEYGGEVDCGVGSEEAGLKILENKVTKNKRKGES